MRPPQTPPFVLPRNHSCLVFIIASTALLPILALAGCDDAALDADAEAIRRGTSRVEICHVTSSATNPTNLLTVSSSAVAAHLAHGDALGGEYWPDADGDGFGDADATPTTCPADASDVANGDDCDDAAADVNPDAVEVCDADDTDEDCDGLADDADDSVDSDTLTTWAVGGGTTTSSVAVSASSHSTSAPLATGITVTAGDALTITADASQTWTGGLGVYVDANGWTAFDYEVGGFNAPVWSLVGQIGGGDYFFVGTGYDDVALDSRDLVLWFWDGNYPDNGGTIVAEVEVGTTLEVLACDQPSDDDGDCGGIAGTWDYTLASDDGSSSSGQGDITGDRDSLDIGGFITGSIAADDSFTGSFAGDNVEPCTGTFTCDGDTQTLDVYCVIDEDPDPITGGPREWVSLDLSRDL